MPESSPVPIVTAVGADFYKETRIPAPCVLATPFV